MKSREQIKNKIRKLHTKMQMTVSSGKSFNSNEVATIRRQIKLLEWVLGDDKPEDIFDEEMAKLAAWLKSEEGLRRIRESQQIVSEVEKAIENMKKIDLKKLREPFTI
jgi:hypothetical protein